MRSRVILPGLAALSLYCVVRLAAALPEQISDREFWKMVTDFSERGGYFSSDNFVSNENTFQRVLPAVTAAVPPGGVYIGVGPEQNFTYISAIRPRMAFVIDIRRQNMLQHLMYKALFELSEDRADFLSILFSRARPAGLKANTPVQELFEKFKRAKPDRASFERNLGNVLRNLSERHGFTLSDMDVQAIRRIYSSFFAAGPDLSYSFGAAHAGRTPTYQELMSAADAEGNDWSYLAAETHFQIVKRLEARNLLVPLVGDFAGPKTIRSVADYLRSRGADVNVFYTSNVERYLFEDGFAWKAFYANVEQLPVDSSSIFIRAVLIPRVYFSRQRLAIRSNTFVASIHEVVSAINSGEITHYDELNAFSK